MLNRLKYERLRRGLSQETLGIAARVDQSTIAQMELGRYFPTAIVLDRLARVLDVPGDQLLKPVEIIKPELQTEAAR